MGAYSCVGGPSVFYGGVSMRFREADFEAAAEIAGNSDAHWPYSYADLETLLHTSRADTRCLPEKLDRDPTEPHLQRTVSAGA